ncbi:MAG: glycosyltransferase family 2 protein [Chitinophagales bacterium]
MNKNFSIIIPFFNEENNIPNLIDSLDSFFKRNSLINCEVIFVDDGSTDESFKLFEKYFYDKSFAGKVIRLSKNYGSHAAIRAGLLNTSGDYAMFLPADLQDSPELILQLSTKAKEGYDIVLASRNNTATGIFEKAFTHIYAALMRKCVNKDYPLHGFDVVFFNRKVIDKLNKNIESNSNIFLQILEMGFKQSSIDYDKQERKIGKSKWTIGKKIKMLIDSFVAFSYAPIRFVSFVGILFFMIGILWTVYIVSRKLIYDDIATGWPMLTSILLLGFGITNIGLGIIAEYLWRTLDASRKRPVFIIDEMVELNKLDATQ